MTQYALSLKIDKVGDREALQALDDLNAKGRRIVEDVSGATGKAMGDVAVAYQRGSQQVKQALEQISMGHRENIRAAQDEAAAAERLSMRNEHAMASASRGLEMLGRTGQLTGRSLDAVVGQVSQMAFAFGPGGQLVAAIGISTAAIVEMFMRTSREAKKAADAAVKEFSRIAHMDVMGQGQAAQELYNGDRYNEDPLKRFGVKEMESQAAALQARITAGTSTFTGAYGIKTTELTDDAKQASEDLRKLKAELDRRNTLLQSIMGPGGSFEAAAKILVASDQPGFTTDAIKQGEQNAKAQHKAMIEQFKQLLKDRADTVKDIIAQLTNADDDSLDPAVRIERAAKRADEETGKALEKAFAKDLFDPAAIKNAIKLAGEHVAKQLSEGEDPLKKAEAALKKRIETLAKHMQDAIGKTLGDGLAAGFEVAFSGKGITGAFEALTSTVLAGLGGFMEQLGAQMVIIGLSLDALASALLSLDGPAAIAAGVALIAAGAGLKAIASSFGHHESGSAGSVATAAGGSGTPSFLSFAVAAPSTPTTSQPAPSAKPNVTFNVFGPDDPNAQRAIAAAMNKAYDRNLVAFA